MRQIQICRIHHPHHIRTTTTTTLTNHQTTFRRFLIRLRLTDNNFREILTDEFRIQQLLRDFLRKFRQRLRFGDRFCGWFGDCGCGDN